MKIRIRPSFFLYMVCMAVLSSWKAAISAFSALLIHELGHYAACCAMGETITVTELTPFGGVMYRENHTVSLKGLRGLIIALAGPFANYAFILSLGIFPLHDVLHEDTMRTLLMSNMVMMCLNLLPILPLDGGQAVFCIGYYLFRVAGLISVLTVMGMVTGWLFIACALYGLLRFGMLNCSLVIIGVYLIKYAYSLQNSIRAENLYAIVQEQIENQSAEVRRIRLFDVPSDMPLYAAISCIDRHTSTIFVVHEKEKIRFIGEKEVCVGMLRKPDLLFKQFASRAAE